MPTAKEEHEGTQEDLYDAPAERRAAHVFSETRRVSAWLILVSLIVMVGGAILLFNSETYGQNLLAPIYKATNGLCNRTLVHCVIGVALSVGVVLFGLGRLRLQDVGIRHDAIFGAVVCTVALWLIVQGITVVAALIADGTISPHRLWDAKGVPAVLGLFLGQLFGNALYEEIMFRGLLIAQLYFLMERALSSRPRWRMAAAIGLSQVVFALTHITNRVAHGSYDSVSAVLADQSMLIFMGLLSAWLYLRTRNLLIAVGMHSLVNAPTTVFASPLDTEGWTEGLVVGITVITLLLWPLVERLRTSAGKTVE